MYKAEDFLLFSVSSDQDQTRSTSFTSPKKAFMMREAASRASSVASTSNTAPDVLVVSTDQGSSNEITVETSKHSLTRPGKVLLKFNMKPCNFVPSSQNEKKKIILESKVHFF